MKKISFIFGLFFFFVFDWVWHGILLKPTYEATAHLWRSVPEMNSLMWITQAVYLVSILFFIFIVNKVHKGGSLMSITRLGASIGIFFALAAISWYVYSPIPLSLALMWSLGHLLQWTGLGYIIGLIHGSASDTE